MPRLLLFFCLSFGTAWALLEPAPPSVADSDRFRETLLKATEIVVYEGLPHQYWQADKLEEELKRPDVIKIDNFPFYTPALKAVNADELKQLLGSPASIQPYRGARACGGYHPDYNITWTVGAITYHAQICLGCHEIVFLTGTTSLKYDMADGMVKRFENLRASYTKKRPAR
ncbi:MAG: hypothetical protein HS117_07740 [Verrucomicrobiaceae bacterium]|nr:hypothetical protein [Verrucomicrobiaceae bacterium]